ncbi:MAG: dipeptidase PepE [Bacteroidales bacterium]|nr:dipeptidase PepE [Bacteroidales bacterium]
MKLLLFSNSTNYGEEYLKYPLQPIKEFLIEFNSKKIVFIPYAAVSFSYDEYEKKVSDRFKEIGYSIVSIHNSNDPINEIKNCDTIVVGGGNTFHLLYQIYIKNLYDVIKEKVTNGALYIGWSAGSNVACPTICTTNDMPIIHPPSLKSFGFVSFQINPHYTDFVPEGYAGETREQRIKEFLAINPHSTVIGLREGCWLKVIDNIIYLFGNKTARIFKYKQQPYEITCGDVTRYLL